MHNFAIAIGTGCITVFVLINTVNRNPQRV